MAPEFFKLHVVNKMGAQIDFNADSANNVLEVEFKGWKLNSSGAVVWGAKVDKDLGSGADLADDASAVISTAHDNSSNLEMGFEGWVRLETDSASAGSIELRMESSVDDGTTYPSDEDDWDAEEDGALLCVLQHPGGAAGTPDFKATNFVIE